MQSLKTFLQKGLYISCAVFKQAYDTIPMVTMVTMGGDLQPGCLADRLLTGLGQPQINP